jgi:hypothetical protein
MCIGGDLQVRNNLHCTSPEGTVCALAHVCWSGADVGPRRSTGVLCHLILRGCYFGECRASTGHSPTRRATSKMACESVSDSDLGTTARVLSNGLSQEKLPTSRVKVGGRELVCRCRRAAARISSRLGLYGSTLMGCQMKVSVITRRVRL